MEKKNETSTDTNQSVIVLSELSLKYKQQLKEITETSKFIDKTLREYYTDEKLKSFKNFVEFLENINYVCEEGGTGKLLFIKYVQQKFTE